MVVVPQACAHTFTGTVTRVIDGDTVVLRTTEVRGQASGVRVRLAEIDAPEMKTEHGPKAKAALAAMIEGKTVVVTWTKRGRYRRRVSRMPTMWPMGGTMNTLAHRQTLLYRAGVA